ncbi:nitrate ABC transporter ATP-binding protein [Candidatus Magnetomorum sp. HK-1]|nr:nitrate ABC transporter ATP-binding protein [Candidatus Magnetomorum sp. HK-1]
MSFSYSNSQSTIFEKLSFEYIGPGFHALFGESGVGKSSLARIISGMILPDKGTIDYHGFTNVIYTTNQERFPGWQSIKKHFDSVLPRDKHKLWRKMMTDFGIAHCVNSRFDYLSLGQQNRVNLIRYLFQDNPVLIMDESLANVDENMRENIILRDHGMKIYAYVTY